MNALDVLSRVAVMISIGLMVTTMLLWRRISKLTRGKAGTSLETTINENNRLITGIKDEVAALTDRVSFLEKDARMNLQNVGVVRFNPFKETGGSQSFAVALTDKDRNGVVISSIYARDRMSVFAKPLSQGTSTYTLTKEEQEAIKQSSINKS
ncbi:DUF4446 family protein [Patescibacteria group bacterium]|nr:DUF4446 family protein [Patescibacteria group bacterium]